MGTLLKEITPFFFGFHPFCVDPLQKRVGAEESKQEVTKILSLVKQWQKVLQVYLDSLTFTTVKANSADNTFLIFSQKTGFDSLCKLSPIEMETICLNCQLLFSGKNKKIFQNVC